MIKKSVLVRDRVACRFQQRFRQGVNTELQQITFPLLSPNRYKFYIVGSGSRPCQVFDVVLPSYLEHCKSWCGLGQKRQSEGTSASWWHPASEPGLSHPVFVRTIAFGVQFPICFNQWMNSTSPLAYSEKCHARGVISCLAIPRQFSSASETGIQHNCPCSTNWVKGWA